MKTLRGAVIGALWALLLASTAIGQTMEVNPEILQAGGIATITINDPSRANQLVTVDIDNGSIGDPVTDYVKIQLNSEGKGTGTWDVPDDEEHWWSAGFNAPGCGEIVCFIDP